MNPSKRKMVAFCHNTAQRLADQGGEIIQQFNRAMGIKVEEQLGCSYERAIAHLESLFQPRMSWWNYGKEWQIDHINPLSNCDASDMMDSLLCTHYTNLQPMWKVEHRIKGKRVPSFDWDQGITPPPIAMPLSADILVCC